MIRRLLKWGVMSGLGTALCVFLSVLWAERVSQAVATAPAAGAVMVLGAGMSEDGTLHASTTHRVEAGVALWKTGRYPYLVVTGGPAVPGGASAGDGMAALAVSLGVPRAQIIAETASLSTLQNALLSRPLMQAKGVRDVMLVTEGFHMARSRASVAWAGIEVVGHHSTTAFRAKDGARMFVREVMAWPFNLARVGLWHILGLARIPPSDRMGLLA